MATESTPPYAQMFIDRLEAHTRLALGSQDASTYPDADMRQMMEDQAVAMQDGLFDLLARDMRIQVWAIGMYAGYFGEIADLPSLDHPLTEEEKQVAFWVRQVFFHDHPLNEFEQQGQIPPMTLFAPGEINASVKIEPVVEVTPPSAPKVSEDSVGGNNCTGLPSIKTISPGRNSGQLFGQLAIDLSPASGPVKKASSVLHGPRELTPRGEAARRRVLASIGRQLADGKTEYNIAEGMVQTGLSKARLHRVVDDILSEQPDLISKRPHNRDLKREKPTAPGPREAIALARLEELKGLIASGEVMNDKGEVHRTRASEMLGVDRKVIDRLLKRLSEQFE